MQIQLKCFQKKTIVQSVLICCYSLHMTSYPVLACLSQNNKIPQPPSFIFLIDVSYNAVKCGMVNIVCQELKSLLDYLPRYAHTHTHGQKRKG